MLYCTVYTVHASIHSPYSSRASDGSFGFRLVRISQYMLCRLGPSFGLSLPSGRYGMFLEPPTSFVQVSVPGLDPEHGLDNVRHPCDCA
jgi:hypothetical protein